MDASQRVIKLTVQWRHIEWAERPPSLDKCAHAVVSLSFPGVCIPDNKHPERDVGLNHDWVAEKIGLLLANLDAVLSQPSTNNLCQQIAQRIRLIDPCVEAEEFPLVIRRRAMSNPIKCNTAKHPSEARLYQKFLYLQYPCQIRISCLDGDLVQCRWEVESSKYQLSSHCVMYVEYDIDKQWVVDTMRHVWHPAASLVVLPSDLLPLTDGLAKITSRWMDWDID